jgi:anti-sigma B factor antagonist
MSESRYVLPEVFDLAAVDEVRAELRAVVRTNDHDLLVDATRLTFIDSTGITVLLEVNSELEAQGRHLLIANVPPQCQRVFDILGLTDLMRWDRETGATLG